MIKPLIHLVAPVFTLVAFSLPAPAQAQVTPEHFKTLCEDGLPPTTVNILAGASSLSFRYDLDVNELVRIEKGMNGTGGWTLGVTSSEFKYKTEVHLNNMSNDDESLSCSRPVINFSLTPGEQVVYIASNFKPGTCGHEAIKRHELRHVKINEAIAQRVGEEIKILMEEAYGQHIHYGNAQAYMDHLNDELLNHWFARITTHIDAHSELHSQIDQTKERVKDLSVCGSEIDTILSLQHQRDAR